MSTERPFVSGLSKRIYFLFAMWAALPLHAAHTDEGCAAFTWNLTREFEALRSPATLYAVAPEARKHPDNLKLAQHYAVTLLPEGSVKFASPPARTRKSAQPMAGLLHFKTDKAGSYRISLTSRHWIDVLDGARTIESRAHEGRSGCEFLHKVVEFELPAGRELTLQLSGDDSATVGLVITPVES